MVAPTREIPFPLTDGEVARFMTRVGKRRDEECWPWTGSRPGSLGCFHLRGWKYKAPRIALTLATGEPIKNGMVVRQYCGDPNCVNPRHLYAWTKTARLDFRFWNKVDKSPGHGPNGDCWIWTSTIRGGYPSIGIEGSEIGAHRLSLAMHNGEPEISNLQCLHSCDNKRCVNPEHLRWGTQKENIQDMLSRGRGRWQ